MFKIIRRLLILLIILLVALAYYKNVYLENKRKDSQAKITVRQEKVITVIEGWNIKQIDNYLVEQGVKLDGQLADFKVRDYKSDYDFLADAPAGADLEGYLFPDTYRVFASTTADDVAQKMLNNFSSKVTPEMLAEISRQKKTLHQIVTMASVVEKEVTSQNDMKVVAGIFWDRIKNGQALESCATLAYVLGENKIQYTYEDTRVKSPYNTYINRGLPPGPIANPGLNAISGTIYPTYTDYNYFLSRSDTKETVFSKTYEEHTLNKQKYLK
ncbi:endolytic transglycosylase MltG [Candidatus Falkowbacteria bacterium CG_4_10_14_0_2_um_filter_41_15]|uniref:Endolytic murein transglycosylase n=4 Tax=Candidatus Falkowiibacteriota TaxID=1752728 RepID=A0A2G9ZMP7_9BACT|nr:MAG: hypothetical protein AUJ35_02485 [Candidatus Falkowbacteria bacterium CG1_02_41_21]PIP34371.1 MAG: hypothetical protein COX21_03270 [Candidatus Falkowbacteria bacterium CG23_combo_of_CG06-09_8_20_14_all_41_10]PIZ09703.1 MAG: endolytic transglycosylase MltG [Candidatus Falkowbacteria bacterium CG_4_10_14_0_8_um_filter_41_36]PJA09734.1 MAG: endolytic transglycosylase MltG [Candidatus Falkowbacteria bacterium CG_4_10_14_0_2_um_filter_41_15]